MRKTFLILFLSSLILSSCEKDKVDNTVSNTPEKGVIKGKTAKEDKSAIGDAKIRIYGTTLATGSNVDFDVTSKSDGTYSMAVPDGVYGIDARTVFNYNNALYDLPLYPVDGIKGKTHESKDGLVKDFTLKLSGKSTSFDLFGANNWKFSYYGGPFEVRNEQSYYFYANQEYQSKSTLPVGSKVKLTFTPDGPLMDGSQGNVVVREVLIDKANDAVSEFLSGDVPLGKYNVTAEIIDANGNAKPAKISVGYEWNNAVPQVGKEGGLAPFGTSAPLTFYMSKSLSTVPYDQYLTNTVIFVAP